MTSPTPTKDGKSLGDWPTATGLLGKASFAVSAALAASIPYRGRDDG